VAVVQYTFTHKQYTEQHTETEARQNMTLFIITVPLRLTQISSYAIKEKVKTERTCFSTRAEFFFFSGNESEVRRKWWKNTAGR